jgi:hypothetical protein
MLWKKIRNILWSHGFEDISGCDPASNMLGRYVNFGNL